MTPTTAFMKSIRSAAMWIVWNIPCGMLAPRLMAFAVNSKMRSAESKTSKH